MKISLFPCDLMPEHQGDITYYEKGIGTRFKPISFDMLNEKAKAVVAAGGRGEFFPLGETGGQSISIYPK